MWLTNTLTGIRGKVIACSEALSRILHQTLAKLLDNLPTGPVLRTSTQYTIIFCSRPEATSDVISRVVVEDISLYLPVDFGSSKLN